MDTLLEGAKTVTLRINVKLVKPTATDTFQPKLIRIHLQFDQSLTENFKVF
jgi:hypothetical protein